MSNFHRTEEEIKQNKVRGYRIIDELTTDSYRRVDMTDGTYLLTISEELIGDHYSIFNSSIRSMYELRNLIEKALAPESTRAKLIG